MEAIHKPGAAGQQASSGQGREDPEVTKEGPANIKVELKEWKVGLEIDAAALGMVQDKAKRPLRTRVTCRIRVVSSTL